MASLNFYITILKQLPIMLAYLLPKADEMIADKENYDEETRFEWTKKILNSIRKSSNIKTRVYGKNKIPLDTNFVIYSNHQDKYDAIGIILSMPKPIGMLWAKSTADAPMCKQVVGLTDSVLIPLDDHKGIVLAIREAIEKVKSGKSLLVFPEGGYSDNHNDLQPFRQGCFNITLKTKTPIVPVCLYDAYKGFGEWRWGTGYTEVHYLDPIYPEEYEGLNKTELCALVEQRISDKMNQLKEEKGDYII